MMCVREFCIKEATIVLDIYLLWLYKVETLLYLPDTCLANRISEGLQFDLNLNQHKPRTSTKRYE